LAHKIQVQRLTKSVTETNHEDRAVKAKQDIETEEREFTTTIQNEDALANLIERQTDAGGEKIVAVCNRIIFILLILAVVISSVCFLFCYPNRNFEGIA